MQVTTDCRPQQLLEYLQGEAATAASTAAANQDRAKAEEDQLLEAARIALGVQHIIRLCSRNDQPTVTEPLRRLIQHGSSVRQAIDLSGLHICLAPCVVRWSQCWLHERISVMATALSTCPITSLWHFHYSCIVVKFYSTFYCTFHRNGHSTFTVLSILQYLY